MHDIFISYSRRDKDAVISIRRELEKLGFRCWMDLSGIPSGHGCFTAKIVPAIKETRVCFLFFLTDSSQASPWAMKEIGFAEKRTDKQVVIIRFNDDIMTDEFFFNFQLTDIIDWRQPEQKEKLLRDLRQWADEANRAEKAGMASPGEQGAETGPDRPEKEGGAAAANNADAGDGAGRPAPWTKWGGAVAAALLLAWVCGAIWRGGGGREAEASRSVAEGDESVARIHAVQSGGAGGEAGRGVGQKAGRKEQAAAEQCRMAAAQGDADAQCELGKRYLTGQGVEQNYELSAQWYRKAALQGNANGQYSLGMLYEVGFGVSKSQTDAVRWYKMAAEQGLADAQYSLGVMYDQGRGIAPNHAKAAEWYRKAAEQGHAQAQRALQASAKQPRPQG